MWSKSVMPWTSEEVRRVADCEAVWPRSGQAIGGGWQAVCTVLSSWRFNPLSCLTGPTERVGWSYGEGGSFWGDGVGRGGWWHEGV